MGTASKRAMSAYCEEYTRPRVRSSLNLHLLRVRCIHLWVVQLDTKAALILNTLKIFIFWENALIRSCVKYSSLLIKALQKGGLINMFYKCYWLMFTYGEISNLLVIWRSNGVNVRPKLSFEETILQKMVARLVRDLVARFINAKIGVLFYLYSNFSFNGAGRNCGGKSRHFLSLLGGKMKILI